MIILIGLTLGIGIVVRGKGRVSSIIECITYLPLNMSSCPPG